MKCPFCNHMEDKVVDSRESREGDAIRRRRQLKDPACVKVVFDHTGRALYFSRSVIPCPRHWDDALLSSDPPTFYQHVGLYAYRREFLLKLAAMPKSAAFRSSPASSDGPPHSSQVA